MSDLVIADPIVNGPYDEPARHFRFDADGITDQVDDGRRPSSYFVPVPRPRKGTRQLEIPELTADQIEVNQQVNAIRARLGIWRSRQYDGVTPTTRRPIRRRWLILAEHGIALEVCPTSNVRNRQVASIEVHPGAADARPRMLDHGCWSRTTSTIHRCSVSALEGDYLTVASTLGVEAGEVARRARNAVRASLFPVERKAALIEEISSVSP